MDIENHAKKGESLAEVLGSKEIREQFFNDVDAVLTKYNLDLRPGTALDAVKYVIEEEYLRRFTCREML